MKHLPLSVQVIICSIIIVLCVVIFSLSLFFSKNNAPYLYSLALTETPSESAPILYNMKLGQVYYFVINCYDKDMDIRYACQSLFNRNTGDHYNVPKVYLTKQTEQTTVYYGTFVAGAVGNWTVSIYFEDKQGNKSNILTQDFTVSP